MKASFETLENKSFFFRFDMFWIYSRLQNSPYLRLLRHALPISLLILRKKKPTVLQSRFIVIWHVHV